MNLNLRQAILDNLHGSSETDVLTTIQEAIARNEEKMLPGLGVLFELYWNNISADDRTEICEQISTNLQ